MNTVIVDFGGGNVYSVQRAFSRIGIPTLVSANASDVQSASRLILPGVGAFGDVRRTLGEHGLIEPIIAFIKSGRPFLGICVGMQMLFDRSMEFGIHDGLRIISGDVRAIPKLNGDGSPLKSPHVGWNALLRPGSRPTWAETPLSNLEEGTAMYFVHSYVGMPFDPTWTLAEAVYGDLRFSAAVARGKVFGCQFHPEKSGPAGLRFLEAFVRI